MARGLRIDMRQHPEGVTVAEINPTAPHGINMYSPVSPTASAAASDFTANFWGGDGFSFGDFLDLINPLQHLPIVGTLYRSATGDDISTGASILGSGLFGGILGAGAAVVNSLIEEATGGEIFDHITSLFSDEDTPEDAPDTAVLASAGIQTSNRAPFGRGDQEATWSDTIGDRPAAPAPVERRYAQNPASGRGAQEATMTSVVSHSPAAATPALAAQADLAPVMAAPMNETPDLTWLAAIPRVENDAYAAAMPYVTPEMGFQLIQAIAGNTDYNSSPGPVDAIDRYSHQAQAVKVMTTQPAIVDKFY